MEITHTDLTALAKSAKHARDVIVKGIGVLRDHALAERALRRIGADPGPFSGAEQRLENEEAILRDSEREVEELEIAELLVTIRETDRISIAPLEAKWNEVTAEIEAFPNSKDWNTYYHSSHSYHGHLTAEQLADWSAFLALKNRELNFANQLSNFAKNRRWLVEQLPAGLQPIVTGDEWRKRNTAPAASAVEETAEPPAERELALSKKK